jgi:AcrR family transcriptional regulator
MAQRKAVHPRSAQASPATRRRPAADTEHAFISAATELFAAQGYNGTSIAQLAESLGLTTASLYYHVESKQDLLLRVLESGMANFLSRLEQIAGLDVPARQQLRLAIENHLDFVLTQPMAVAVFLRERRFLESPYREQYEEGVSRYDGIFAELVEAAMSHGEVGSGDPTIVRLSILGMINWVPEWYRPGGSMSKSDVKESMSDLIMNRLLAF